MEHPLYTISDSNNSGKSVISWSMPSVRNHLRNRQISGPPKGSAVTPITPNMMHANVHKCICIEAFRLNFTVEPSYRTICELLSRTIEASIPASLDDFISKKIHPNIRIKSTQAVLSEAFRQIKTGIYKRCQEATPESGNHETVTFKTSNVRDIRTANEIKKIQRSQKRNCG